MEKKQARKKNNNNYPSQGKQCLYFISRIKLFIKIKVINTFQQQVTHGSNQFEN